MNQGIPAQLPQLGGLAPEGSPGVHSYMSPWEEQAANPFAAGRRGRGRFAPPTTPISTASSPASTLASPVAPTDTSITAPASVAAAQPVGAPTNPQGGPPAPQGPQEPVNPIAQALREPRPR